MSIKYRSYIIIVLVIALVLFVMRMGAMLILDPLQIFHKPWIRDTYFVNDMRVQAAGIINNSEFDSIIMGSSMAQNFSPREASGLWDASFVNISPAGTFTSESFLILKYALRKKALKNIIMSIGGFAKYGQYKPTYPAENYAYLYNENSFDDIKIYLELKYLKKIFCRNIIIPTDTFCKSTKSLENVVEWGSAGFARKRFGGLDKWLQSKDDGHVKDTLQKITNYTNAIKSGNLEVLDETEFKEKFENIKMVFDHDFLSLVEENPNTDFYFFFPPYSRLRYAIWQQTMPDKFDLYIKKIRYVVRRLEKYSNGKVFGFDQLDFLNDIANYMDDHHYHPRFNSAILEWMKRGEYQLTNRNIDTYVDKITELAKNYDVDPIADRVERYLNEHIEK